MKALHRHHKTHTPARLCRCRNLRTGQVLTTYLPKDCPVPTGFVEEK